MPSTVLSATLILTLVTCTIWPHLFPMAVLLVPLPLAIVGGPVGMFVHAIAVSLVVHPLALIDVPVDMLKSAIALRLVIDPLAFIHGTIGPSLDAVTMPQIPRPIAGVGGPIFKGVLWPLIRGPNGQGLHPAVLNFHVAILPHIRLHPHIVVRSEKAAFATGAHSPRTVAWSVPHECGRGRSGSARRWLQTPCPCPSACTSSALFPRACYCMDP
mmetsp:Transcript_32264/g.55963  ORF Transcript_32264/g.55963 Transcript_32264/m.55963 type:complete len:214 (-) Transcript_32264:8-649(-)